MYLPVSSFNLSVNPASRIATPFYRGENGGSYLMGSGSPGIAAANSFLSLPVLSGEVESPIPVDSVRPACTWQALGDNYETNEWADPRTSVGCAPTPAVGSWC